MILYLRLLGADWCDYCQCQGDKRQRQRRYVHSSLGHTLTVKAGGDLERYLHANNNDSINNARVISPGIDATDTVRGVPEPVQCVSLTPPPARIGCDAGLSAHAQWMQRGGEVWRGCGERRRRKSFVPRRRAALIKRSVPTIIGGSRWSAQFESVSPSVSITRVDHDH